MMLVHQFLERAAAGHGGKTALVCGHERLSYRELNEAADRLAASLTALGIKRRDRVVVLLENCTEAVISIYGILKCGGVLVMLNPALKAEKLGFILKDSGARAAITHVTKEDLFNQATKGLPDLRHLIFCGSGTPDRTPSFETGSSHDWNSLVNEMTGQWPSPEVRLIDVDLAALIYTSGSTGEPKGVVSAHCNIVAAATSITTYLGNREDDIVLNVLPLSFDYGLYQAFMTPLFAGTLVLGKSFVFPIEIIRLIERERVTGLPLVPTMAAILAQIKNPGDYDLTSLRYISNTGAALHAANIRFLRERFPNVLIFSMYGLTECKRALYLPPEELERRPTSVGKAIPNEEVFVVDPEGNEVPPGEVGELVVRGSNVMQGYWNRPEETAATFRPGSYRADVLLHTGDLFRMDEEGFLYFVSRMDDLIKTKGERVSPREVENTLCSIPGVTEAAVIGVEDELLGHAIKAYVVPDRDAALSEQDIMKFCSEHLEPHMVPKYIVFRETLPKSPNGKTDTRLLRHEAVLTECG